MNKKIIFILPFVLLTLGGCSSNKKDDSNNHPFTPTVIKYTVTWTDYDGTVLEVDENLDKGTMPEYNSDLPTREPNARYTYAFKAWSPQITPVERNITYMATYSATVNTYTITWKDWDGSTLLLEENVPYGTDLYYTGDFPTRENTDQASYNFDHWDPEPTTCSGDHVFTAVYTESVRRYFITWKDWDNRTLKVSSVPYGTVPVYDGFTPNRPDDEQYTYTFSGWSPEIVAVTGIATYTAQYTATPIE